MLKSIDTMSESRSMTVWDWLKVLKGKVNTARSFKFWVRGRLETAFLNFVRASSRPLNILGYDVPIGMWRWIESEVFQYRIGLTFNVIIEVKRQSKNFFLFFTCPRNGFFVTIKDSFVPYQRLADIYDPEKWDDDYHENVSDSSIEWLWRQIVPRLALNEGLTDLERFIPLEKFSKQIKRWLSIANEYKKIFPSPSK